MQATMKRKGLLAKIHMGQKQLEQSIGLDKSAYRDMLEDRYGVDSAKHLTDKQLVEVVNSMEAQGAKFTPPKKKRNIPDEAMARKIWSLWQELHRLGEVRDKSEKALNAWVQRQAKVASYRWLNRWQAERVIEALKKWVDRIEEKHLEEA